MVLIQDRILKIDIYNFEMSYKTPEKSLKSNQIYSVWECPVISRPRDKPIAATIKQWDTLAVINWLSTFSDYNNDTVITTVPHHRPSYTLCCPHKFDMIR